VENKGKLKSKVTQTVARFNNDLYSHLVKDNGQETECGWPLNEDNAHQHKLALKRIETEVRCDGCIEKKWQELKNRDIVAVETGLVD